MTEPFSRSFRVRWSETNALGQVHLAGYLRYLIETAWDWGATGGLSFAENEALGLAWVIRETAVTLYRPLTTNDVFDFTIWLINWRRVRGTRCFELRLSDGGELVAQGTQQVATLDSETLRPVRPPAGLLENFLMENPLVIEQEKFPKFPVKPERAFVRQRRVEWRDLDLLQHVNNATYAAYAEEAAAQALSALRWSPDKLKTKGLSVSNRRFHIRYQAPALWGETLNVVTYLAALKPSGGTWHIEMVRASDGEAIVQCVLEWSLANRMGAEQAPPDDLALALQTARPPGP